MRKILALHQRFVSGTKLNWWERTIFLLLLPVAMIYGVIGWLRYVLYASGLTLSYRSTLPIVSVGNLAVGGTGKTPVVDWLVKEFQRYGKRPAIVSRGYSGKFSDKAAFVSNGQDLLMAVEECGDEPYLLAKRNPACPVVVAKKRVDGVRLLETSSNVDVIILDDGFQHFAVSRNVDIVLLDARAPFGNCFPLPLGNLREFPVALQRADFLLLTRSKNREKFELRGKPVYQSSHQLSHAVTLDGVEASLAELQSLKLCAFAGIANPDSFFDSLIAHGLSLTQKVSLGDHVEYDSSLVATLRTAAKGVDALITTEKDGVKLVADMFELPCYQVSVNIEIENAAECFDDIIHRLWRNEMPIRPDLLDLLACPKCKGKVVQSEEGDRIVCQHCKLRFPVRDDIPVMLIDEAESF